MTYQLQPNNKVAGLVVFLSLVFSVPGLCLEPPTKEQIQQYKKDGTLAQRIADAKAIGNHLVPPEIAQRTNQKLQNLFRESQGLPALSTDPSRTPPTSWRGLPTTGTPKIFALLIAFADYPFSNTATSINDKIFGAGAGGTFPYESLKNFYYRSSYNLLTIGGNTLGWYTTAYNRSAVVQTDAGRENLIKEALNSFDTAGHDFSQYDNNGDGKIDYFVVIWTGPAGDWASFWWGYQTSWYATSLTLDGKTFGKYSWQWEARPTPGTFNPKVVIHETGHALGVPDFYDYDDSVGPRGGVGDLDQMDGNWGDHNCWSKFMLDWLTPTVYSGGTNTATLRAANANPDAALFFKGTAGGIFSEFFMVQNRNRGNNDTTYPSDGLLIWHVDSRLNGGGNNFLYNNSYTDHKLLRLMEADGLEEIEQNIQANAGDYYISGKTISPTTRPHTFRYDGVSSMMGVDTITVIATPPSMTCRIFEIAADATPPTGAPSTPTDEGTVSTDDTLRFDWTIGTAADPESGIGLYYLQVGTTPGGSNVFDGVIGTTTTKTISGAWEGETHYARVRVSNGTGAYSAWSGNSDGILVSLPWFSCTAVDNCALSFKTYGNQQWIEQGTVVYYGSTAGKSGTITHNQKSLLISRVVGPGNLSFYWKVSSEANWDYLNFYIDRVLQHRISGEVNWTQRTYAIAAGAHELRWEYAKDTMDSAGSDAAWVDKVVWDGPGGSAGFYPVTPCRVFDTREASGPTAGSPALGPTERRVFAVATKCLIPSSAKSITANVTVVNGTIEGDLQVTAATLPSTVTSTIVIPISRARANNATIQLAIDGTGGIAVKNTTSGVVHVILDVNGYFQ